MELSKHFEKAADAWPLLVVVVLAAASDLMPAARGLRARHPFGSLGAAFIAGVALSAAQSVAGNHLPALKRRLT